jgi:hypothetical protein
MQPAGFKGVSYLQNKYKNEKKNEIKILFWNDRKAKFNK